jgi:hypothetical protein
MRGVVTLSVFLCLGVAILALTPAAIAGPQKLSRSKAVLEAGREAEANCKILLKKCGGHRARCLRVSPSKFRCQVEAREGREIGDLIIRETLFIYRTARPKLVKEIVEVKESRVGHSARLLAARSATRTGTASS